MAAVVGVAAWFAANGVAAAELTAGVGPEGDPVAAAVGVAAWLTANVVAMSMGAVPSAATLIRTLAGMAEDPSSSVK